MDEIWIGIDDTDSPKGGCTTYFACLLMEKLRENYTVSLPRLIRLNPTIPYKTRGNGAVSFKVTGEIDIQKILKICREHLRRFVMMDDPKTNPGVVIVDEITEEMREFAENALKDVINLRHAKKLIEEWKIPHITLKNGRGIIGAVASVALKVPSPTYELLTYRHPSKFGKKREINRDSVFLADNLVYPLVWDTVDRENDEIILAPGSPDPVLFGLRGCDIYSIIRAYLRIESEPVDKFQLFVTNQSTDMHYIPEEDATELKNFRSYIVEGVVSSPPKVIRGGHVFFYIKTRFGEIKCGAYEPTKQFRKIVRRLVKGDRIRVWGSMKKNTLNLEKLEILELEKIYEMKNPSCHVCGRSMESAGKNKGFRCRKCGTFALKKKRIEIQRDVEIGLYEVPPRARRHLAKPLIRFKERHTHPFR